MISIASLTGLMLLAAFVFLEWRKRSSCVDRAGKASDDVDQEAIKRCNTPDVDDWCAALEEMCQGAVFCFDESLRLKASGERARNMFTSAQAEPHLVDIAPAGATSNLLEMMASARRKAVASKKVLWKKQPMSASTTSVGRSWIALLIKKAVLAAVMLLACVGCSNSAIDREPSIRQDHVAESSANERLAGELIRHGRLLLRSNRYLAAIDSARLAAFLSTNPQSLAFVSECKKTASHEVELTMMLAADARDAGDFDESERLRNMAEAMRRHLEAR